MQWRYLNAANERLEQLALGDFDGDGRCDVFAVHGDEWVISSGGTAPWKSLGSYNVPLSQLAFGKFDDGKAMDVFRRASNGRWWVVTPGSHDWRPLARSSFPLSSLRFGDFTGDGITDVLAVQGGRWSISRSGTGAWERLNPGLSDKLTNLRIADVDVDGTDDVVRLNVETQLADSVVYPEDPHEPLIRYEASWQVSWSGAADWVTLPATLSGTCPLRQLDLAAFAGHFDRRPGKSLMLLDHGRFGRIYNDASGAVTVQNLFPH